MLSSPVYTTENECQDCYKCVRHCPVKAIRIVDGTYVGCKLAAL